MFGGRGGAARGGGDRCSRRGQDGGGNHSNGLEAEAAVGAVGRVARGGVHIHVPQTDRQHLRNWWELFAFCKSIGHQLQHSEEYYSGLAARRPSRSFNDQMARTMLLSLVPWMKQFEKLCVSHTIHDTDQHQTVATLAISWCTNVYVNSATTSGWLRHLDKNYWQECKSFLRA